MVGWQKETLTKQVEAEEEGEYEAEAGQQKVEDGRADAKVSRCQVRGI